MPVITNSNVVSSSAQIADGIIVDADIAAGAAIARSKIVAAAGSGANADITSLTGLTTPLSAAQGGTGVASPAAKSVLVGQGAGAVSGVAPGANGNVLKSNGTDWTSGTVTTPSVFVPLQRGTAGSTESVGAAGDQAGRGISLPDAATNEAHAYWKFPVGTSLSSMSLRLAVSFTGAATYDYDNILFYELPDDGTAAVLRDSMGLTQVQISHATIFGVRAFAVPAAAFDALVAGKTYLIALQRQGANASDTNAGATTYFGFDIVYA